MAAESFSADAVEGFLRHNKRARQAWSSGFTDVCNSKTEQDDGCFETYLPSKDQSFQATLAYRPKPAPPQDNIACSSTRIHTPVRNKQAVGLHMPSPDNKIVLKYPYNDSYDTATLLDVFHDRRLRSAAPSPDSPASSSSSPSSPPHDTGIRCSDIDYRGRPLTPGSLSPISPRDLGLSQSIQDSLTSQDVLQLSHEVNFARRRLSSADRCKKIPVSPLSEDASVSSQSVDYSRSGLSSPSNERASVSSGSQYHRNSNIGGVLGSDYLQKVKSIPLTPPPVHKPSESRIWQYDRRASPTHSDSTESIFIGSDEDEDSDAPNGAVVVNGKGAFVGLAFGGEIIRTKDITGKTLRIGEAEAAKDPDGSPRREGQATHQNAGDHKGDESGKPSQDKTSNRKRDSSAEGSTNRRLNVSSRSTGSDRNRKPCGCPPSKTCSRCRGIRKRKTETTNPLRDWEEREKGRNLAEERHKQLARLLFLEDCPSTMETPSSTDTSPSRKRSASQGVSGDESSEPNAKRSRPSSVTGITSPSETPFIEEEPKIWVTKMEELKKEP